jgi:hypothetical protein
MQEGEALAPYQQARDREGRRSWRRGRGAMVAVHRAGRSEWPEGLAPAGLPHGTNAVPPAAVWRPAARSQWEELKRPSWSSKDAGDGGTREPPAFQTWGSAIDR